MGIFRRSIVARGLPKEISLNTVQPEVIHTHTKFGVFCIALFADQFTGAAL